MKLSDVSAMTVCQKCGGKGMLAFGARDFQPAWCKCTDKQGRRLPAILKAGGRVHPGGPYNAAPGTCVAFIYESHEDAAFRELCRVTSNAERQARDALCGIWVRRGRRGVRRLPKSSPKRQKLERAYATALRALNKLRKQCKHPHRSMFNPCACGVCYAYPDKWRDLNAERANAKLRAEAKRQSRAA